MGVSFVLCNERKSEEEVSEEVLGYFINLVIPKIDLDKKIYNVDSELNDVDYNIEILGSSDISRKLFFLAGHSGSSNNCYFNRVRELEIGDYIYIMYGNDSLIYRVIDSYFIVKNGYMEISNDLKGEVFLITCDVNDNNKQFIVRGELIN